MTPLAKVIFAALVVFTAPSGRTVGAWWCRPNCEAEAQRVANILEDVARAHHLDPYVVAALAQSESGFNVNALGSLGEVGLLQVNWQFRVAANDSCHREPERCDYWRAWWGAYALADARARCGDIHGAIGMYKVGRACLRGPIGARILRRARRMREQARRVKGTASSRVAQAGRVGPETGSNVHVVKSGRPGGER